MKLLFVCTGNSFRSPLAEALLKRELATLALDNFATATAGIRPSEDPDQRAREESFANFKLAAAVHSPRQITQELLDWADQIYVFENSQGNALQASFALRTSPELLGEGLEIADPWVTGDYELAAVQIAQAVDALVRRLAAR